MTETVSRALVDAFYEAYAGHHTENLAAMLHEDVTWTISGPVDVLPYCGCHRGKQAVIHLVD
jgi:ketosteroid isomerase-like protein